MTVIISDSFNRSNSTTSLGSTDNYNGGATRSWNVATGIWGISNNQAYMPSSTALSNAYIEAEASDGIVYVTMSTVSNAGNSGMVFRLSDNSNYWRLVQQTNNNTTYLQKCVAGSISTIGSFTYSFNAGTVLKVKLTGTTLEVFLNDVSYLTKTDSFNSTATKHGLHIHSNTSTRFDNFVVEDFNTGGGETGTAGSISYSTKNIIYSTASNNYDSKQSIYSTQSQSFDSKIVQYKVGLSDYNTKLVIYRVGADSHDTKNTIYNTSLSNFNTKQIIFNTSNVNYQTKQSICKSSSSLFDTLQQLIDGGLVGSLSFDTKLIMFENGSKSYDNKQIIYNTTSSPFSTKQNIYSSGQSEFSVRNQIYRQSTQQYNLKQIIHKLSNVEYQLKQAIYTSGTVDFDTLQKLLSDFFVYSQVLKYVLEIHPKDSFELSINQKEKFDLNVTMGKKYNLNI